MNIFLSRSLLVFLLVSVFQGFSANAQEITASFLKQLQQQLEKTPIEKVHLHLDKPHYVLGDEIWFKAYVLDDRNAIPSLISGVLYIDLVDQTNKVVRSLKLPLLNGVTWGALYLQDNLTGGKYTIFAYTEWMKNAGSAFFFKKELMIKNPLIERNITPRLNKKEIDVQFFPEGGGLVEEMPSKLAFKAINETGLGEEISGAIYDNDDVEVVNFESSYLGMGHLFITPQSGKTYTAKIKFKNNAEKIFPLPTVAKDGYQLSVNTLNAENFIVKVLTSNNLLGEQDLTMLVHHNGTVYLETKVSTEKQIVVIPFKTVNIPSGIVTVTILNKKNIPLCERIVFVNNTSKHLAVALEGLATTYPIKSKLSVDVNVSLGKTPIQGSFSIATTNTSLVGVDNDNETHIFSSLLLKSDLVGYIENPNAYFTANAQQNNERIDYLMLTQGWRKIIWKKLLEGKLPKPVFDVETLIQISGTLLIAGKPAANTKVSIISTPKMTFSRDTITDQNGRFNFDELSFKEGSKFVVKASTPNPNKVKFVMDSIAGFPLQASYHFNTTDTDTIPSIVLDKYNKIKERRIAFIEERNANRTQLNTVEIIGEVNKAPNSLNINGPGIADATFDVDDLKNTSSLNQFLEGRVSGLHLLNSRYYLTRGGFGFDEGSMLPKPLPMVIYLDGAKVDDNFTLEDLNVNDVESVEILKSQAKTVVYGTNDGVILITTKTGGGVNLKKISPIETTPGMLTILPKGFALNKNFYSPRYNVQASTSLDSRTTVFWEPNLITDTAGKANISYFNADVPGVYRMVIEGIDVEGNLARKVLTYEVK